MPSKQKVGTALPSSSKAKIEQGMGEAEAYYAPIASVWASLPPEQREAYLSQSPTLSRILVFARAFLVGLLLLLALPALAATRTTVADGLWSASGTWDTGVPADGDTAVIANAVTFDVNQSALASGVTVTINSGGSFTASTTFGVYSLKCNGNVTVNAGSSFLVGSAGTPYPSTCSFTVNLNGARYFTGAGTIAIYCSEPVVKTLQLNTATLADATVLDVRQFPGGETWDPTADAGNWVNAQTVRVDNYGSVSSTVRTIASTASNTLTLNAGTMPVKAIGSLIHLINRNVWITGATGYAFSSANALTLAAQLSGNSYGLNSCTGATITGGTISGNSYGLASCTGAAITGGTISGNTNGLLSCPGAAITGGTISGNTNGLNSCTGAAITGGTISGNTNGLVSCTGVLSGASFSGQSSADIYNCPDLRLRNCLLGSTSEVYGYNTTSMPSWAYVESRDHDQVAGAFKSWTRGGITVKQATTVPTGYSYAYQLTCESATMWGFYQERYTLAPGQTARWIVYRNQSVDTASKAEIVALGNDPLVGGTALATATFTTDTGTWEAKQLEYTNTSTVPLAVQLRVSGKSASGTLTFLPVFIQGHEG